MQVKSDKGLVHRVCEEYSKLNSKKTNKSSLKCSRDLPKQNESLCSHKNLYVSIDSSLFIMARNLKATDVPCLKNRYELWHVHKMQ